MPRSKGWGARRDDRSPHANAIGDIVDDLLREPHFEPGVAVGRLAGAWEAIVGPRLASETTPERLEAGTLVIAATSGPWGAQARFLAEEIRAQANAALGLERVRTVQIIVRPDRA